MTKFHYFNITYHCDSNCLFCAANIGLIDHAEYTMTPEEFRENLTKANATEGDRVMISGGEPTLSPYFWEILDIVEAFGCEIDLTTNGHYFESIDNVVRLLEYSKIIVRIPFFGLKEQHDNLTGREGNFDKANAALDNFYKFSAQKHFCLNVKFLLSKATVESNADIYSFLKERYGTRFEYTLSPLLVSKKVLQNKEALLAPYSELLASCKEFVEIEEINCDIIPLCLLSKKKVAEFLHRKKVDYQKVYSDAKLHHDGIENYSDEKCKQCILSFCCDKFLPSYIDYYGTSEIKPFLTEELKTV